MGLDNFIDQMYIFNINPMWINIASENGAANTAKIRDILETKMNPKQIELAHQMVGDCVVRNYKKYFCCAKLQILVSYFIKNFK
jgi:hypothetical protein